ESQHIVGALRHDLLSDRFLTTHGIDGDDTPLEFKHFEQLRDGRDLVGFLFRVSPCSGCETGHPSPPFALRSGDNLYVPRT
ncbi:MAG: hypothetical protein, partial [Olavius algarvensis Gamma 1 endosymbiont]